MRHPVASLLSFTLAAVLGASLSAQASPVQAPAPVPDPNTVALTLDACGGAFDWTLGHLLVALRVPATIFATERWIDANPQAVAFLREHADLFAIENHGARHHAPVFGTLRGPYGVPAVATPAGLAEEVDAGAKAVRAAFGIQPHWFRGATALYSPEALQWLAHEGWGVAGYSIALDDGATLPAAAVTRRALSAHAGDVLLGHINRPASGTAQGLSQALPILQSRGLHFGHLARP